MKQAPAWLFALLAATFVIYTDDYVIAGLLPELAGDLDVAVPQAGQLITVFSLTVAIAAPAAAVVFARSPRLLLFTISLVVFSAANLGAAFTPSFSVLMVLRVVAAVAAASMTPAVFAFAAKHAPPDHVGRFIAFVSLGITGSVAAGVPLGTWVSGILDWRATFAMMSVAGVVVLVVLFSTLPRTNQLEAPLLLSEQIRSLKQLPVSLGLLANTALMTGSMMMLTYLAPYLAETALAGVNERAVAFAVSGCAGVLGIWLGGIATDRWGPDRTLTIGISVFLVTMVALWALWLARPAPLPLVIAVGGVWGGIAFWNSPAIQARIHAQAGPVAPQALALNTSGTYLGIAAGGAIGGAALASIGVGALPPLAAGCGVLALVLLRAARTRPSRTRTSVLHYNDTLSRVPRRVAVAGVSGTGKTTLARRIEDAREIPHCEIDALFHGAGWVPRTSFLTDVHSLIAGECWVTEWQYSAARPLIAERAQLLVWLDLPFATVTLPRLVGRSLRRRLRREQLWNGNVEAPLHTFFTDPDHVVRWAFSTRRMYRELIPKIAAEYPHLEVVRLRSQREVELWLTGPLTHGAS